MLDALTPRHQVSAGELLLAAADLQDNLLIAANDLERLQRLLADASQALLRHFHGASDGMVALMHGGSQAQQTLRDDVAAVLTHMGGAVTALQFQDMASQLIEHLLLRLHHCADQLARDAMDGDEDGAAIVADAPLRPNPVTQDEVDAGSIELF